MAKKVQVLLTCDMHDDDTEGTETVTFGLDGVSYEIDLCDAHGAELRDSLAAWVGEAERVGGRRSTATAAKRTTGGAKRDLGPVREWARGQGLKVSDRGRVSQDVLDQYDAAH